MSLMGLVSRTSGTEGNRFTNRATTTTAKMRTKSPKVVSCHRCKRFVVKSKEVAIPKRRLRRQRQKRSLAYFFILSHLATDYSLIFFFFYLNLAPAPALAEAEAAHLTPVSRGRQYDKSN